MSRVALFPGSFDPYTMGHYDIVAHALRLFDKVVIGVGDNYGKKGVLTTENKVKLIEKIYEGESRVEVEVYGGLTGDFCRGQGICAIVRGVRNASDFEYERNIEQVNRVLYPEIITLFLMTSPEYSYISSSVVRELLHFGKETNTLMPNGIDINDFL